MNAAEVIDRLKARHAAPQWAFVENVCESTKNRRRCDAMAVGQWESVGHHLHGFEVKVARSDWLKEMQDPAKSETFARYCDFWWLVTAPGIAKIEELPANWGLMEVLEGSIKVRRLATKREPEPLSRGLLVMLTRRAAEAIEEALAEARRSGYEEGRKSGLDSTQYAREYARLTEDVAKFEAASGVKIRDEWGLGDVGASVKLLVAQKGVVAEAKSNLKWTLDSLERAAAVIRKEIQS